jgi:YesN/AraC family two-component response regulator
LESFNKNNIDIVVCDFFMPVQNGNDFLEIVKKNKPSTKCLLVSGDVQIKNRKFAYVDSIFSKLDLNELIVYVKVLDNVA